MFRLLLPRDTTFSSRDTKGVFMEAVWCWLPGMNTKLFIGKRTRIIVVSLRPYFEASEDMSPGGHMVFLFVPWPK